MDNLKKWRFFIIIFIIFKIHNSKSELLFVYEHCRHGARGSANGKVSIQYNELFIDEYKSQWKGNGELTLKGKMQQYILGIRNRYKYSNLINYNKYNPEELLIHVTNMNRTKESAYNQVLGMFNPFLKISENDKLIDIISESNKYYYPPNLNIWKNQKENIFKKIINEAELSIKLLKEVNENNNNTKIFLTDGKFNLEEKNKIYNMNIKFIPFSENRMFFVFLNCTNNMKYIELTYKKKFIELIKENLEDKYGDKFKTFFKYEKKENFYDFRNVIIVIIDNFLSNYFDERKLEEFFNQTGIDKEEYYNIIINLYKYWVYHLYCDKKTCILESEKLMLDLIEYMENRINNKDKLKMVIDVGHDFTIGPMELFMYETFGIDYTICYFSCNLYFELHKVQDNNKKDEYYVKYYVDEELKLNINYDLFKKKIISKLWSEKEKDEFCNGNLFKILYPKAFIFFTFIIIPISIGIIVFILYKFCKNKINKKNYKKNKENGKELELI